MSEFMDALQDAKSNVVKLFVSDGHVHQLAFQVASKEEREAAFYLADVLEYSAKVLRKRVAEHRDGADGWQMALTDNASAPEVATDKKGGVLARGTAMSAELFNKTFPVGSHFRYYPIVSKSDCEPVITRSEAWELASGHVVVQVAGRSGGVSVEHLETAAG